ncbi:hypothetical protein AN216_02395 [Streptomyces oceani]|uniref:Amino acid ABC transporter permease n=2 Tax=Streptomyces oceani TaxID=1075402 RepID=A0A1E7KNU1_9ACTN|nr:hypothetical protein AN216_02395 [Streptomyces oceani]
MPRMEEVSEREGTATQLAGSGDGGGSGRQGKLRQSSGPWTSAAGVAEALGTSMKLGKDELGTSHQGIAQEGAGLASITALDVVRNSWEQRLEDARKECATLDGKLRKVADAHGENEQRTKESFEAKDQGNGKGRP